MGLKCQVPLLSTGGECKIGKYRNRISLLIKTIGKLLSYWDAYRRAWSEAWLFGCAWLYVTELLRCLLKSMSRRATIRFIGKHEPAHGYSAITSQNVLEDWSDASGKLSVWIHVIQGMRKELRYASPACGSIMFCIQIPSRKYGWDSRCVRMRRSLGIIGIVGILGSVHK